MTGALESSAANAHTQQHSKSGDWYLKDDWSRRVEEALKSLQETRDSVKSTLARVDHAQAVGQEAGKTLQHSQDLLEARLSAARSHLDMATEQMCAYFGNPAAKNMMLQKSMSSIQSGNASAIQSNQRFSLMRKHGGNCTNSTLPAVSEDEVDLEDISRCGRTLSRAQGSPIGGADTVSDSEDHELQLALAASLESKRPPMPSQPKSAPAPKPPSRPQTPPDPARASITDRLQKTPFLERADPRFAHGRMYQGPMDAPRMVWESQDPPRKDHEAPEWLTASEFEDVPEVVTAKIQQLAELLRLSKRTVLYTGAGISASVIGQAALSGQNVVGWKPETRKAKPTFTHHALGLLGQQGLVHSWVQQNHDGLPQKAGFPQESINEIHGSWYDPSNPVVKYSGSLHSRAGPLMQKDAETADLVIVLGTSLSGLNADRVAHSTAQRSLLLPPPPPGVLAAGARVTAQPPGYSAMYKGLVMAMLDEGDLLVQFDLFPEAIVLPAGSPVDVQAPQMPSLGVVCINLQQTAHDGKMSLRLNGKSDGIMRALLRELGLKPGMAQSPTFPKTSRVLVPYDKDGCRLSDPKGKRMWLDLSEGQQVRITPGHNIQGAKQPQYMHIGASEAVTHFRTGRSVQPGAGLGSVIKRDEETVSFVLQIEGETMHLGIWWLEAAIRGAVDVLPIVNQEPQFEECSVPKEDEPAAKAFARPSAGARSCGRGTGRRTSTPSRNARKASPPREKRASTPP